MRLGELDVQRDLYFDEDVKGVALYDQGAGQSIAVCKVFLLKIRAD